MGADADYDAFLSYAAGDRRHARRIQRFLESWIDKRDGRRLTVFLDETDIRGGRLDAELRDAAHRARTLVVAYSPAAAESKWVAAEVQLFLQGGEANRIAVAIVGGKEPKDLVGRAVVEGSVLRVHDLRRGRWLAPLGLGAKLELLRLLAFVADVDMRRLRNWHLRRTLRSASMLFTAVVVPLWIVMSLPRHDWTQLDVHDDRAPIYAVAAEVVDGGLTVASRFRAQGPQGFRDYIAVTVNALSAKAKGSFNEFILRRRLLPLDLISYSVRQNIPRIDIAAYTTRPAVGQPWAAELEPGRYLVVIALAPSDEELEAARDAAVDFGAPIPRVSGALIVSVEDGRTRAAVVGDMAPIWEPAEGASGRSSPARGLAATRSPEGDVWLGMQARDEDAPGGLWVRRANQDAWERVPGFLSVLSIDLDTLGGRTRSIIVAERHAELFTGIGFAPRPTRVVARAAGDTVWRTAPAPPFGTRSDVELVGRMDGRRIVRVDEHLFQEQTIPVWRFLLDR